MRYVGCFILYVGFTGGIWDVSSSMWSFMDEDRKLRQGTKMGNQDKERRRGTKTKNRK